MYARCTECGAGIEPVDDDTLPREWALPTAACVGLWQPLRCMRQRLESHWGGELFCPRCLLAAGEVDA